MKSQHGVTENHGTCPERPRQLEELRVAGLGEEPWVIVGTSWAVAFSQLNHAFYLVASNIMSLSGQNDADQTQIKAPAHLGKQPTIGGANKVVINVFCLVVWLAR